MLCSSLCLYILRTIYLHHLPSQNQFTIILEPPNTGEFIFSEQAINIVLISDANPKFAVHTEKETSQDQTSPCRYTGYESRRQHLI